MFRKVTGRVPPEFLSPPDGPECPDCGSENIHPWDDCCLDCGRDCQKRSRRDLEDDDP
jgi:hypothetical protein